MKTHTTLEHIYNDMLGVLPPAAFKTGANGVEGFLVGEPTDHNSEGAPRYGSYFKFNDEYVAGENMTVKEFHKVIDLTEKEIRANEETPEDIQNELDLIESHGLEAVNAYHALGIEMNHGLENFEEAYQGEWDSDEDFAQSMAEESGEVPTNTHWPHYCIDWEYAARELMMDYSEQDGHYFRNI